MSHSQNSISASEIPFFRDWEEATVFIREKLDAMNALQSNVDQLSSDKASLETALASSGELVTSLQNELAAAQNTSNQVIV